MRVDAEACCKPSECFKKRLVKKTGGKSIASPRIVARLLKILSFLRLAKNTETISLTRETKKSILIKMDAAARDVRLWGSIGVS